MLSFFFFFLMFILLFPLNYFNNFPVEHYSLIFKTLCSLCFVLCSYFSFKKSKGNKKYFTLIFIGLVFCLFGDVLLELHENTFFTLGTTAFMIGHIFFIISFIYLTSLGLKDIILYAVLLTLAISFLLNMSGFDFRGMFTLVLVYTIIIVFMVTKSLSLLKFRKENTLCVFLTIIGAFLFFISDFILLFMLFYKNCPVILSFLNLIIYYTGQGFLAISLRKTFKKRA